MMGNKFVAKTYGDNSITIYSEETANGNTWVTSACDNVNPKYADKIIKCVNNHDELVKALDSFLQYDKENDLLGWLKDFDHIVHTEFSVIMQNAANIIEKLKDQ